jgi:hypothetical protein
LTFNRQRLLRGGYNLSVSCWILGTSFWADACFWDDLNNWND